MVWHELSLLVEWTVNRHVSLSASYAHFNAGPFLRDTGPGLDLTYVTAFASYKF